MADVTSAAALPVLNPANHADKVGTVQEATLADVDAALSAAPIADDERAIAARVRELTPQQFRVLQMLGTGLLNKQIGYELGVSEATIKAHMSAILRKLGANNRTQAVLIAGKLAVDPETVVAHS